MTLFDLHKRKCKNCGKEFEGRMEYVYKEEISHGKIGWFCSWGCLQAYRRKKNEKGIRRKARL